MYKLGATLRKAAVWSDRGLAISVRVESGMCTETRVFLARESVVSMRIVCVVNLHLLHKWAFCEIRFCLLRFVRRKTAQSSIRLEKGNDVEERGYMFARLLRAKQR